MILSPHVIERLDALNRLENDGRPRSALERLCIERQVSDLKTGHERGLVWDHAEAERGVQFVQLLRHWKAPFTNRPFLLEPWQAELIIRPLLGWYRDKPRSEGGIRRFTSGYTEIPRKNGKTTLAAPLALQGLIADGEYGGEVYSAAVKRDQAAIVFEDAKHMLRGSPYLSKQVKVFSHSLTCPRLDAFFKPLSSDSKTLDGLNVSRAVVDEIHKHPTRHIWDLIKTGTGSRVNPLVFGITTAGFDRSTICWELHEDVRNTLEGHHADDSLFGFIACAEADDDIYDPEIRGKANPNYGISVTERYMDEETARARRIPSYENTVRRLNFNQWTEQAVRAIPMLEWDQCKGKIAAKDLVGRRCWAGMDLASTRDVVALALCFPETGGVYKFLLFFWCPETPKDGRTEADTRMVRNWADTGKIRKLPGSTIDYAELAEQVMTIMAEFDVQEFGYDPWGPAAAFVQHLTALGFNFDKLAQFRQNMSSLAAPTKVFIEDLIHSRKLEHGADPVLRWMAANLATKTDVSGNIRPDKEKSADKIDGIVACIIALGLILKEETLGPSKYEKPGMLAM